MLAGAAPTGCGLLSRDHGPRDYRTVVPKAESAGLQVYWLGPTVEREGVRFDTLEAKFPEGQAGVEAEGIRLQYFSSERFTGDIYLSTYKKDDWTRISNALANHPTVRITRHKATVAGTIGEVIVLPLGQYAVNRLIAVADMGEFAVTAETARATAEGGENVNVLMEEDRLLRVLEDLRPYPE